MSVARPQTRAIQNHKSLGIQNLGKKCDTRSCDSYDYKQAFHHFSCGGASKGNQSSVMVHFISSKLGDNSFEEFLVSELQTRHRRPREESPYECGTCSLWRQETRAAARPGHVSWLLFYCCDNTMTKAMLIKGSI